MSCSRDQTSLTGSSNSLAMTTAWRTYSWIGARRPKPPPSIIRCTVTLSFGTPAAIAAVASAVAGSWVGTQIFDAVGVHMRGAGLRLHGRVREKRHRVIGFDAPRGAAERRRGIAVGASDLRGRRIEPAAHRSRDRGARNLAVAAVVPVDAQRVGGAFRSPPGIGHHRDRIRHAHHAAHALHARDRALVDRFQRACRTPDIARWRRRACSAAARRWHRPAAP